MPSIMTHWLRFPGCDKNMPGSIIAMGRLNRPAIAIGLRVAPLHGPSQGKDLNIVSAFEALGQNWQANYQKQTSNQSCSTFCPGPGACGGMYTANTMAAAIEALGMSLPFFIPHGWHSAKKKRMPACGRSIETFDGKWHPLPNYDAPCFLKTPLLWQWSWEVAPMPFYTWLPWLKVWMCILPSMTSANEQSTACAGRPQTKWQVPWCRLTRNRRPSNCAQIHVGSGLVAWSLPYRYR